MKVETVYQVNQGIRGAESPGKFLTKKGSGSKIKTIFTALVLKMRFWPASQVIDTWIGGLMSPVIVYKHI